VTEKESLAARRAAVAAAMVLRRSGAEPVVETLDDLWRAYDRALNEGSDTWKAEFRRRIERRLQENLMLRQEDIPQPSQGGTPE
jgi:hypothetical protein